MNAISQLLNSLWLDSAPHLLTAKRPTGDHCVQSAVCGCCWAASSCFKEREKETAGGAPEQLCHNKGDRRPRRPG